jgi:hypothetical protein
VQRSALADHTDTSFALLSSRHPRNVVLAQLLAFRPFRINYFAHQRWPNLLNFLWDFWRIFDRRFINQVVLSRAPEGPIAHILDRLQGWGYPNKGT